MNDKNGVVLNVTRSDGVEMECILIVLFDVYENEYAALLPTENINEEKQILYLYRCIYDENDTPQCFEDIVEDEEYDAVVDKLNAILPDQGYEELVNNYKKNQYNATTDIEYDDF